MQESSTSRRVEFEIDDDVTIDDETVEHLKRTHPLRSSFLHGDPNNKTTRSSTRSYNGTIKKSSSRKSTRPGQCPVHGKKVTVIGSVPDVVIPVSVSRHNSSSDDSIGVQSMPLKSGLKSSNGAGVQKRQGWAGLQWALLVGCYALMLLLAVVVGVVLIHQHRQSNSADSPSGTISTQPTERTSSDLSQGPQTGQGIGIHNKPTQVNTNQIKPKSASGGPPSRDLRGGSPKSLSSQEISHRQPKVHRAGLPVFPIQHSSQPSLTGHNLSWQPHLQTNQSFNSFSGNNQDRGSSASRLPTRQSSIPVNRTRGSSFPRQQTNQQTVLQQNVNNRRSSLPRTPIRESSFPGDQTRSSSFPASSHQVPNQSSSPNQRRNQPSSHQVPNQSSPNQRRNQPSFPIQQTNQPRQPNQRRNQPSSPIQQTNQPRQPVQPVLNTRHPSLRRQQPHLQASQLPFNNNPSSQPHFPFEQLHQPTSPDRTSTIQPNLDDTKVKIAKLWNHQNSDGSFTYGYINTDGSFKNETRGVGGCVEGIYGYVDPVTSQQIRVPYQTGNTPGNSCNVPQPAWVPTQTR